MKKRSLQDLPNLSLKGRERWERASHESRIGKIPLITK